MYNYYNNNYYSDYGTEVYMCVDGVDGPDDRCDWDCAHSGPYCYDGGSDGWGCSEWSGDEAGPCCVSSVPTSTPAPSMEPMPLYVAVDDQGCDGYIHMDGGYYGGDTYIEGGQTTLEQCAAAVWAYNGQNGCMGDYFYFEWSGHCNCPTDSCSLGYENGNAGSDAGQLFQFTTASSAPSATPAPTVDCPHAKLASGKCIFLTEDRHTFYECHDACGDNAALVCMDGYEANSDINDFVSSIAQYDEVWIGYMTQTGSWYDGSGPTSVQSPATCATMPVWGSGQPESSHCKSCAVMYPNSWEGGTWWSTNCFDENRCVCEYGASPDASVAPSSSEFEDIREECDGRWRDWEPLYNDANACCYNMYGSGCADEAFWECENHGYDQFAYNAQYARRRLSSKADAKEEAGGEHRQLGECNVHGWCQCMSNYLNSHWSECEEHYSMDYYQDYYSYSYSYLQNFYAVPGQGCSDFMTLYEGLDVAGYGVIDDKIPLGECAKAVKAFDGTSGCMGDNFFYAWDGTCAFERALRFFAPFDPARSRRVIAQVTARWMGARSPMRTIPITACCSRSTPRLCPQSFRPRSRCPAFSALPVRGACSRALHHAL